MDSNRCFSSPYQIGFILDCDCSYLVLFFFLDHTFKFLPWGYVKFLQKLEYCGMIGGDISGCMLAAQQHSKGNCSLATVL